VGSVDLSVLIALVALGLGIANTAAQIAAYRRERTSVTVEGRSGHQVYPAIDPDEPEAAWITVTNTGRHPVTIESMHFVIDSRRTISMMDPRIGDEAWVLQPGQPRTAAIPQADLILEPGDHLIRAVAEGPGGRRWTGPVYGPLAPAHGKRRLPIG